MALRTNVAAGDPNLAGILNEERVAINALQYNSGIRLVTSLLPASTFVSGQGGLFLSRVGDTITWVFHDLVCVASPPTNPAIALPLGFRTWVAFPPAVLGLNDVKQMRLEGMDTSSWVIKDLTPNANYRCTISVPALDPGVPPTSLPGTAA